MRRWKPIVALIAAAVLAGCAQTPQTVRLAPDAPDEMAVNYGQGRNVALRVVDNRLDKSELGELQNRNEEPAPLHTKQDLAYVVKLAAGQVLKAYGFNPTPWNGDAERRLTISIDSLHHTVGAAIPRAVNTSVKLSATAVHGNKSLKLKAEQNSNNQITHRPSPDENAEFIDDAITKALGRLYSDDLAKFLASGETGG